MGGDLFAGGEADDDPAGDAGDAEEEGGGAGEVLAVARVGVEEEAEQGFGAGLPDVGGVAEAAAVEEVVLHVVDDRELGRLPFREVQGEAEEVAPVGALKDGGEVDREAVEGVGDDLRRAPGADLGERLVAPSGRQGDPRQAGGADVHRVGFHRVGGAFLGRFDEREAVPRRDQGAAVGVDGGGATGGDDAFCCAGRAP